MKYALLFWDYKSKTNINHSDLGGGQLATGTSWQSQWQVACLKIWNYLLELRKRCRLSKKQGKVRSAKPRVKFDHAQTSLSQQHKSHSPNKSNFSSLRWFFLSCLSCFSISAFMRFRSFASSLMQQRFIVKFGRDHLESNASKNRRVRQRQLALFAPSLELQSEQRVHYKCRIFPVKMGKLQDRVRA